MLVLCQEAIVLPAIMRAKVIGVMKMRDDKGEDDKLIAVHADDPTYWIPTLRRSRATGCELKRFFEDYKALENKKVLVSEPQGRSEALQVLRDAIRLYDQEKERLIGAPHVRHRAAAAPRRRAGSVAPAKRAARRAASAKARRR